MTSLALVTALLTVLAEAPTATTAEPGRPATPATIRFDPAQPGETRIALADVAPDLSLIHI